MKIHEVKSKRKSIITATLIESLTLIFTHLSDKDRNRLKLLLEKNDN